MNLLTKLKTPNNSRKYALIAVVLVFGVAGSILWIQPRTPAEITFEEETGKSKISEAKVKGEIEDFIPLEEWQEPYPEKVP